MKHIYRNLLAMGLLAAGFYLMRAMDNDAVLQAGAENAARVRAEAMRKSYTQYLQELKDGKKTLETVLGELEKAEKIGEDVKLEESFEKNVVDNLKIINEQIKELESLNPNQRASIGTIINKHIDQRSELAQKQIEEMIPDEKEREAYYRDLMQMRPEEIQTQGLEQIGMYLDERSHQEGGVEEGQDNQ
jgi:uncharacterized protein YdeI (YjbR/CyaY-like superfamily)